MSFFNEKSQKFTAGLTAGCVASLLTQPLEVIKTIILVNPSKDLVIEQGYNLNSLLRSVSFIYKYQNQGLKNFFKGGTVACMRQSLGFAFYTFFIDGFDKKISLYVSSSQKYLKYSLSACLAKIVAVTVTSPLILVKTRFELITQKEYTGIFSAFRAIVRKNNVWSLFHGISSVLSREITFSMFHYSMYRYLVDEMSSGTNTSLFFMAYFAGFFAILFSHPFEVVRNRIMIEDKYLVEIKKYRGLSEGLKKIMVNEGVKGFFKGILPRLVRKPINSAIVWTVYEIGGGKTNSKKRKQE